MTDFCDKDMWPPSSPDLNPMDFAIWSILETDVCATPHSSTANLKRTLQTAWSNLDESAVRRSCLSAVLRFEAVVKAKGGHIEWCYCRLDIHMFTNICTKNQLNIFANNRNIWKNGSVNLSAPPCILEPPDGDGLRSGQRPQQAEVIEWDGPCPTMWARKTFASKFCRLPGISRSEGRDQPVRPAQQALLTADSVLVNPSIQNVRTKFIKKVGLPKRPPPRSPDIHRNALDTYRNLLESAGLHTVTQFGPPPWFSGIPTEVGATWDTHRGWCRLGYPPRLRSPGLSTEVDAAWDTHRGWCRLGYPPRLMPPGIPTEVGAAWDIHRGCAVWDIYRGWCRLGYPPRLVPPGIPTEVGATWDTHRGWCHLGYPPRLVSPGILTEVGAVWDTHRGWCRLGYPPRLVPPGIPTEVEVAWDTHRGWCRLGYPPRLVPPGIPTEVEVAWDTHRGWCRLGYPPRLMPPGIPTEDGAAWDTHRG